VLVGELSPEEDFLEGVWGRAGVLDLRPLDEEELAGVVAFAGREDDMLSWMNVVSRGMRGRSK